MATELELLPENVAKLQVRAQVETAAAAAMTANRAYAGSTPTAAQTTAQVKALSRQNNGIIRLLLGRLDATD